MVSINKDNQANPSFQSQSYVLCLGALIFLILMFNEAILSPEIFLNIYIKNLAKGQSEWENMKQHAKYSLGGTGCFILKSEVVRMKK